MEEKNKRRGAVVFDAKAFKKELGYSMPGMKKVLSGLEKVIPSEENVQTAFMLRKLDEAGDVMLPDDEALASNEDIMEASEIHERRLMCKSTPELFEIAVTSIKCQDRYRDLMSKVLKDYFLSGMNKNEAYEKIVYPKYQQPAKDTFYRWTDKLDSELTKLKKKGY
ncbi:MAG: hypothetical protein JJU41_13695 [Bacteroidetes bacterium]|nr:hypothetical protein [Bacteroidota bacterium]